MMVVVLFYLGLGALLTLEEAGVFFLPGDISLVAAGIGAAHGGSVLLISWAVAAAGMVAGSSVLFYAVTRHRASSRVLPRRVGRLIRRHGVWGVAVARLVPGLRNATVFAAASARMRYTRFLYGLVPAALVWPAAMLLLGYFGGGAVLSMIGAVHNSPVLQTASIGLLLGVFGFIVWRLRIAGGTRPVSET